MEEITEVDFNYPLLQSVNGPNKELLIEDLPQTYELETSHVEILNNTVGEDIIESNLPDDDHKKPRIPVPRLKEKAYFESFPFKDIQESINNFPQGSESEGDITKLLVKNDEIIEPHSKEENPEFCNQDLITDNFKETSNNVNPDVQDEIVAPSITNRPKTPYNDFLQKLKDPSCLSFVSKIKSFVESFGTNQTQEEASDTLHTFMNQILDSLVQLKIFQSEEQSFLLEKLERFIVQKLYSTLHNCLDTKLEEDLVLFNKIKCLDWVELKHLELNFEILNLTNLPAITELKKLDKMKCPRDKLVLILNCCRTIVSFIESTTYNTQYSQSQHVTADDILPMLIYIIIKSNPTKLKSEIEFIQMFRHPSLHVKEEAYFFTQFSSAVLFLVNLGNSTHLHISDEDFVKNILESKKRHNMEDLNLGYNSEIGPSKLQLSNLTTHKDHSYHSQQENYTTSQSKMLNLALSIETRFQEYQNVEDLKISQLKDLFDEYSKLVEFKNTFINTYRKI